MENKDVRIQITEHAIRWATNMLVEVGNNHGGVIPPAARNALRDAIMALGEASDALRKK